MSSSQTVDSPQVKLALLCVEAFGKRDMNLVAKHFHKDVRRIIYPRSLGMPECNGEEWLQQVGKYFSLFDKEGEVSYIRSHLNPSAP